MPDTLKKLIDIIAFLPWIGDKSATRLALFLLKAHPAYLQNFSDHVGRLQSDLHECSVCHAITDRTYDRCDVCRDERRSVERVCVVEDYIDMIAIERLGIFDGRYHVLGGTISPVSGVLAEDLSIAHLFERVKSEPLTELILATNANLEGEATALYIEERMPRRDEVKISRLSRGLPNAGYIEYADEITLVNAFKGRK